MSDSSASISPQQMKLVLDVSRMLAITTDVEVLLSHLATAATSMLNCERASIFLYDAKTDELWTRIALHSTQIRVPSSAGIVGQAFVSNQLIHVPDPYKDPRFNPEPDRRTGFVTCNLLTAPMVGIDGKPVGVIQAVNKRKDCFSEGDFAMVQLLADHAGVAIQRFNLQQAELKSAELRREMDLAKRVQEALIPKHPPKIEGIDVVGWTRAASVTGGDCFDLWELPDGRLAIFLGDASGHGIAPALVVSQVRTLIRALVELEPDPCKLLARVNERMYFDLQDGQFITVFLGYLDGEGKLEWTSAGQGPILVRLSPDSPVTILETPGYPIGFTQAWPADAGVPLQLLPGGTLLVASDGIYEAMDPTAQLLGHDPIVSLLESEQATSSAKILATIRATVDAWQTHEEPNDDQTVVAIRRPANI